MLFYKTYLHQDKNKPWVTFVHGAGGSSSIWFSQIRYFKESFNLLFVDLRGHGKSRKTHPKNSYNFTNITDEVVEVIEHLNIKHTHLIGISLGSVVIMDMAHRHASIVTSLVMGGAIIHLNLRAQVLMKLGVFCKHIVPYLWLYNFFAYVIMPKKNHKDSRHFFVEEAKKMNQKEFIKWFSLVSSVNGLLSFFRETKIKIPVLYIMGSEDYMFLPSVKRIVKNHQNTSLTILPNCGHVVNIEASALFNKEVSSFISEV
ncbi:pimeloyl-ACP methyl ester carboxylesterase [Wenyingzhuangia heitensis]|uniref:Pimeloyl-ACP methyl ester carboxylesterase n=1 Tax=Wenyingzhuangia heitensis TaxID=1487859 RepID=A0ABX0U7F2_9FLAO|nr:alpha/beta hydrolase [Wenyingzhuangia heitensis]NIJ44727.1 pimeloyl-ACP methyl ester carboxylesterase [Wenyingzhuangia heitensis]